MKPFEKIIVIILHCTYSFCNSDILTSLQFAIQREPTKIFSVDVTPGNKKVFLYFQPEDLTALKDQMKMLSAIVMELEEKSEQNKA